MAMRAQSGWPVIGQRQVNSPQRRVISCVWSSVSNVPSSRSAAASGRPSLVSMGESLLAEPVQRAGVAVQDGLAELGGVGRRQRLGQHLPERLAPPGGGEVVELRRAG